MTTTIRRTFLAVATIALALVGGLAAAAPASATSTPVMTGIRTGLHPGYDRIVLDMSGHQPGVTARWTDELIADGSGEIFWLTGEHFVDVMVTPAAAHDEAGNSTYSGPQRFRTRNLRNVMAVGITGDFEANLSIGIGARSQTWVRVFTLSSPTRVVIDVGN